MLIGEVFLWSVRVGWGGAVRTCCCVLIAGLFTNIIMSIPPCTSMYLKCHVNKSTPSLRRLALTLPLVRDWGCCGWLLRRLIAFPLESASSVEHDLHNATYQQGPCECGSCKYSIRQGPSMICTLVSQYIYWGGSLK